MPNAVLGETSGVKSVRPRLHSPETFINQNTGRESIKHQMLLLPIQNVTTREVKKNISIYGSSVKIKFKRLHWKLAQGNLAIF